MIRIRKIFQYAEHLQRRRVDLLDTEQRIRRRRRFERRDPIAEAEEQAFLDKLEEMRPETTTHRRGHSAKDKNKEAAVKRLMKLGYKQADAERIADQEEED